MHFGSCVSCLVPLCRDLSILSCTLPSFDCGLPYLGQGLLADHCQCDIHIIWSIPSTSFVLYFQMFGFTIHYACLVCWIFIKDLDFYILRLCCNVNFSMTFFEGINYLCSYIPTAKMKGTVTIS